MTLYEMTPDGPRLLSLPEAASRLRRAQRGVPRLPQEEPEAAPVGGPFDDEDDDLPF